MWIEKRRKVGGYRGREIKILERSNDRKKRENVKRERKAKD